jgi:predicted nucleic acid-binding protein
VNRKAILDTSVLTDILLNSGEAKATALKAISRYNEILLPVYAIKEFKAGPLANFVWIHNKLVVTDSYEKSIDALQRMSRTPRRYTTSTALQALKEASGSIAKQTTTDLLKKYGETTSIDKILCDEFRLALKFRIFSSWKRRRKIATDVITPLACYREVAPYEKRGLIELEPKGCKSECSMSTLLKSRPGDLRKMRDAIKDSDKTENKRRSKILRQLYRTPGASLHDKECRYLGDAVFVFLAPEDAVILTTNITDHGLLAKALGKNAVSPGQVTSEQSQS